MGGLGLRFAEVLNAPDMLRPCGGVPNKLSDCDQFVVKAVKG